MRRAEVLSAARSSSRATGQAEQHTGDAYNAALLASIEAEIVQLEAEKRELVALQNQLRTEEQRMVAQLSASATKTSGA